MLMVKEAMKIFKCYGPVDSTSVKGSVALGLLKHREKAR